MLREYNSIFGAEMQGSDPRILKFVLLLFYKFIYLIGIHGAMGILYVFKVGHKKKFYTFHHMGYSFLFGRRQFQYAFVSRKNSNHASSVIRRFSSSDSKPSKK